MIYCLLYLAKNSLAISSTQEKFPANAFISGIKEKDIYTTPIEPIDQLVEVQVGASESSAKKRKDSGIRIAIFICH